MTVITKRHVEPPPRGAATCSHCSRWWTGGSTCHCAGCHRTFGGLTNFDRHRRGGHCEDPATIRDKAGVLLMELTTRNGGDVWISPDPRDHTKEES